MLILCPECELQVSEKALSCPHCGYPMKPSIRHYRKPNKRRRLPNGFGQISEIKNRNLRKPFRVMVTVGKTSAARPICKLLKPEAYFETYNEAYTALVEYNKNPYDLSPSLTVKELYDRWSDEYFKTLTSISSVNGISSAWNYCTSVHDMRVIDLRARHIKGCIDNGTINKKGVEQSATSLMKNRIKSLFNIMLDYAVEYELVDRNYSRTFRLTDEVIKDIATVKNGHIAFTEDEMKILWDNIDSKRFVDAIIIQCYTGWRPQELCLLELNDIDIENWTFKGGMKTESGIDRIVPIHSRIKNLVMQQYKYAKSLNSKYLLNYENVTLNYRRYQRGFKQIITELKLDQNHKPHDGRTHFVTMAKKYGVDEYAIKYIVGHSISDITEKVYTKRELDWLKDEIEKIK